MKPIDVHIDKEFLASIPRGTDHETELLKASIADEGFRDPITVWREKGILVDGHRRHAIWMEMAKGGFFSTKPKLEVVERSFASREEAMNWIDANQLTRRNLTPEQVSLIRGRLYNRTKQSQGGNRATGNTAAKLAAQFAVSERTILNDSAFASAVAVLKPIEPAIEEILPSVPRSKIIDAGQLAEAQPQQALALLAPEAEEKPVRRSSVKKSSLNTKRGLSMFFKSVRAGLRQVLKAMPNATADICQFFGELQAELTVESKEAA